VAEDVDRVPGVPPPDQEPVSTVQRPPVRSADESRRSTLYRLRFAIAYGALAAVVGAAVGSFIVLVNRNDPVAESAWSTWRPTREGQGAAEEIADHVSRRYRLPSGNQLVGVLVGPAEVQDVTVRAIAVRASASGSNDDIKILDAEGTMMYILCGLGDRCSIREGRPSTARHQLLRREALELALYTFKYVDGAKSVVAFLPPRPDADPEEAGTSALFFEKRDLKEELEQPLRTTLSRASPPKLGELDADEVLTIERLTERRVFSYEFQQAQEGSAILILTPLLLTG
jgi:hypothetical protein